MQLADRIALPNELYSAGWSSGGVSLTGAIDQLAHCVEQFPVVQRRRRIRRIVDVEYLDSKLDVESLRNASLLCISLIIKGLHLTLVS
jgi:hypothetical protein